MTQPKHITDRDYTSYAEDPANPGESRRKVLTYPDPDAPPQSFEFAEPDTLKIYNEISPGTANTEFSIALSPIVRRILIRSRTTSALKLALVSGETATNYLSIPAGTNFDSGTMKVSSLVLYLSCSKASQTIEVFEWS